MKTITVPILLFTCFALGLPTWMMLNNEHSVDRISGCSGECYQQWFENTGGIVAMAKAEAAAKAAASPQELGKKAYVGCVACHGAGGEGGIGPQLVGQSAAAIAGVLTQYKNGETRGPQSNLMWGQAASMSSADIDHLAAFIESL